MNNSTDYHDYVFKGGEFIGEFEQMYRNSKNKPWNQDKTAYLVYSELFRCVTPQYYGLEHEWNYGGRPLIRFLGKPKRDTE